MRLWPGLTAPPDFPACFKGASSRRGEGRGRGESEREGRGKERDEKGREGGEEKRG